MQANVSARHFWEGAISMFADEVINRALEPFLI
jgi:hypothetical protein